MENVLVTGFGPFGDHKINASWEAVKELSTLDFDGRINLITEEIPVEYDAVANIVAKLWKKYRPKLCIHVGVSGITNTIQLETCAHNSNYDREDINFKCPQSNQCLPGGDECLYTNVNVNKICEVMNKNKCLCKVETSSNAGRYLCEFIYYKSLNESLKPEFNDSSVLFIHVPTLDHPYSKQELANTLKRIVVEILKSRS